MQERKYFLTESRFARERHTHFIWYSMLWVATRLRVWGCELPGKNQEAPKKPLNLQGFILFWQRIINLWTSDKTEERGFWAFQGVNCGKVSIWGILTVDKGDLIKFVHVDPSFFFFFILVAVVCWLLLASVSTTCEILVPHQGLNSSHSSENTEF